MLPDINISKFYWETAGLVHIPGFAYKFLNKIADEFAQEFTEENLKDESRVFNRNALRVSPTYSYIVNENSFHQWLTEVIGGAASIVAGDASVYRGDTYWHRDVHTGTLGFAKLAVYLTVNNESVPFSYFPGTHILGDGKTPTEQKNLNLVNLSPDRINKYSTNTIHLKDGDAILFNPRLLHSVLNDNERKQLAVIFSFSPNSESEKQELLSFLLAKNSVL